MVFSLAIAEQVLVGDDDQGIDACLKVHDALLGDAHAARALEVERLGHHADGQYALVAGRPGDGGRRAGAGAAAHAGGDEHHVRAGEMIDDLVDRLLGRGAADFGLRAGAETLGHRHAHLDHARRRATRPAPALSVLATTNSQPCEPGADHVVDGVAAGAAHAKDGDFRLAVP